MTAFPFSALSSVPTRPSPARIEVLDPLRGLAALAVAWYHFVHGGSVVPEGSWLWQTSAYGWLGVEVFFVISGFIIPYSMHRGRYVLSRDAKTFIAKRVIRLDPPYFAAIALSLGLWYASTFVPGFQGSAPDVSAAQLLAHLGYLNAFLGYEWLNPVFWTLAIEFQFYLFAALLFPLLLHRSALVRTLMLGAMCGSAFLLPQPTLLFHYLGLFALGLATCHYYLGLTSLHTYLLAAAALTAATTFAVQPVVGFVGVATALVIAFVRIPRFAPLAWLGAMSYSLYLVHVPIGGRVINLGARLGDSLGVQALVLTAAVVASLITSYAMYRLVEGPAQRWSSSLRYDSKPPDPPVPDDVVQGVEISMP